jgi:antitoxin MazE
MRTRLVKIGNSRGVRIPKPLLEQAGLEDEVELTVVDGEIRISAAPEPETGAVLAALSEDSFGDWNRPEEDAAWASLQ